MSLTVQLYTMLSMAAMGIYLGAAIDTYGRLSRRRPSFNWIIACNDVLFWLVQALVVFYVLLHSNNGEIRFYIFLALLCGFAGYQSLMKQTYQRVLEYMIGKTIQLYHFIVRLIIVLLINPIKYLLKLLYSLCIMVLTTCLTIILFMLNMVWKPLRWILFLLFKWTGVNRLIEKTKPIIQKIKGFIRYMKKKE